MRLGSWEIMNMGCTAGFGAAALGPDLGGLLGPPELNHLGKRFKPHSLFPVCEVVSGGPG